MDDRCRVQTDDQAITAVVATILLVAIAVLAAATIYVAILVFVGGSQEPADAVALTTNQQTGRITVSKAVEGANWGNLRVHVSAHGGPAASIYMGTADPYQNDAASAAGADLLAGPAKVSSESIPVRSDDFLAFCASQATDEVEFTVVDEAANAQIGKYNFLTIRAC